MDVTVSFSVERQDKFLYSYTHRNSITTYSWCYESCAISKRRPFATVVHKDWVAIVWYRFVSPWLQTHTSTRASRSVFKPLLRYGILLAERAANRRAQRSVLRLLTATCSLIGRGQGRSAHVHLLSRCSSPVVVVIHELEERVAGSTTYCCRFTFYINILLQHQ